MNFRTAGNTELKAWKDIWSAGQSVSGIHSVESVDSIVTTLHGEYHTALSRLATAPVG
jgi:nitronate monooxygenase